MARSSTTGTKPRTGSAQRLGSLPGTPWRAARSKSGPGETGSIGTRCAQPFKQAHREIYILTDAERRTDTYSNRFAAHIIRQHQFSALCQQRGWRYTLQGNWDSFNIPTLQLPQWDLRVEFWVQALADEEEASASGVYRVSLNRPGAVLSPA